MGEAFSGNHHVLLPDCPGCQEQLIGDPEEFESNAEVIDTFQESHDLIHNIIDCLNCETRVDLVINNENPLAIEVWLSPVILSW